MCRFLEVGVKYPENLARHIMKYLFLCENLVCNLKSKENYIVQIRKLQQVLNHGLKLQAVHKVIKFN